MQYTLKYPLRGVLNFSTSRYIAIVGVYLTLAQAGIPLIKL